MLPFLMENDISSQQGDRTKLQTVPEEKQLTSDESGMMAGSRDHHLSTLKDSAEASYEAELERIIEEIASSPYENCLVKGAQLQYAVAEVTPDGGVAQVQKVTQEEVVSDGDGVLAGAQGQLAVSEDLPKESNVSEAERMVVEEKATESDENSVPSDRDLQPAVSAVSPPREGDTEKEATPTPVLDSSGDESRRSTSDKGEIPVKDQPQPQPCKNSESGCSDVGFRSPTNTATVDNGRADRQDEQDSVASPDDASLLLGVPTICCKPSSASVSAEEVSGSLITQAAESGSRRVRPCGSPSLEKRCLSPKKISPVKKRVLSPKKGILKRPTNGCKGICMCLDCSVFRLRADRAFEFSRKQMEEADDIIGNLLEEVASLRRSLAAAGEKPSGQQEHIEEACKRASRVEEVARERQMQMELNAHCKIPGPRVKFAQYVYEKMALSPMGSNNCRRQPPL